MIGLPMHLLGHRISDRTVGNILKRNGIMPASCQKPRLSWSDFIVMHKDDITAFDFFTDEVYTATELITFYVLFFMQIGGRKVHLAQVTPQPNESCVKHIARHQTSQLTNRALFKVKNDSHVTMIQNIFSLPLYDALRVINQDARI